MKKNKKSNFFTNFICLNLKKKNEKLENIKNESRKFGK